MWCWLLVGVAASAAVNIYCQCDADGRTLATCCVTESSRVTSHLSECPKGEVEVGRIFFEPDESPNAALACSENVCCALPGNTEVLTRIQTCEAQQGTPFVSAFCPPACCRDADGTFTRLPEGEGCFQLPDVQAESVAPEQCDDVCCRVDGSTGKLSRGECLAASGAVLPDTDCAAAPTSGAPDTTTTEVTTTDSTGPKSSDPTATTGTDATTTSTSGSSGSDASTGGPAGACTCNDLGVVFTIVSGCEGAPFSDATQPSYCRSAVEFVLMSDPDTFEFADGAVFGFPECQVQIHCP